MTGKMTPCLAHRKSGSSRFRSASQTLVGLLVYIIELVLTVILTATLPAIDDRNDRGD
jgi:hypothetical protein